MIQLIYHNNYTWVATKNPILETDIKASTLISKLCSVEVIRFYKIRNRNRTKRRKVVLNYYKDYRFPSGWYFFITEKLRQYNYPFETVQDNTQWDVQENELSANIRYYQRDAIEAISTYTRGIIKLPTGSGKTFVGKEIIRRTGLPTIFMVPTRVLLYQTYEVFAQEFGKEIVGVVGDGEFDHRPITVATAQTLYSRKDSDQVKNLLGSTGLLILDEAHRTNKSDARRKKGEVKIPKAKLENMYFEMSQLCDAQYRIGLTATPGKLGSQSRFLLEGVTGPVICSTSVAELVEHKFLARPRVVFVVFDIKTKHERDYRAKKKLLMEDFTHKLLISQICLSAQQRNLSTLVICDEIEKQIIPYSLLVPGSSVLVSRATKKKETIEKFRAFRNKEIMVLFSTVMKEGVDIPSMNVIVTPFGGKEPRAVIQKTGRVLRPAPGKKEGLIIDIYHRDGSTLEDHSKERISTFRTEGYDVEITNDIGSIFNEH